MRKNITLVVLTAGLALGLATGADAQVSLNVGNPSNGGWTVGNAGGQWYATPTYANPYATSGYTNGNGYANGYGWTNNGYNRVYNNGYGWNGNSGLTATRYNSGYAGYTQPARNYNAANYGYGASSNYYGNPGSYGYSSGGWSGGGYPANYGWNRGYGAGYGRSYGWR